jgi:hypothetical protein
MIFNTATLYLWAILIRPILDKQQVLDSNLHFHRLILLHFKLLVATLDNITVPNCFKVSIHRETTRFHLIIGFIYRVYNNNRSKLFIITTD